MATADAKKTSSSRLPSVEEALERQRKAERDLDYIFAHREEWRERYSGKIIAVHDERVVAVGDSTAEILAAAEATGVPVSEVRIEVVTERPVAYLL